METSKKDIRRFYETNHKIYDDGYNECKLKMFNSYVYVDVRSAVHVGLNYCDKRERLMVYSRTARTIGYHKRKDMANSNIMGIDYLVIVYKGKSISVKIYANTDINVIEDKDFKILTIKYSIDYIEYTVSFKVDKDDIYYSHYEVSNLREELHKPNPEPEIISHNINAAKKQVNKSNYEPIDLKYLIDMISKNRDNLYVYDLNDKDKLNIPIIKMSSSGIALLCKLPDVVEIFYTYQELFDMERYCFFGSNIGFFKLKDKQ